MMERQWWGDVAAQLADTDGYRRVFGSPRPPERPGAGVRRAWKHRSPRLHRWAWPRPDHAARLAATAIRWNENIPLSATCALRGTLRRLRRGISPRYPLVELLTAVLFAAVAWRFGEQPAGLLWCGFVAALLALAAIDWDTTLLPDDLTLPLLWAGLLAARAWAGPIAAADAGVGRDRRLPVAVVGVLAVQARHRQGRHGLWRLQAAGGAGRLAGLADDAADRAGRLGDGRPGRHRHEVSQSLREGRTCPSARSWPAPAWSCCWSASAARCSAGSAGPDARAVA